MSQRARAILVTAVVAAAAAGGVVAVAARSGEPSKPDTSATTRPAGPPPLALDLGLRTDREARDLRRATQLYAQGERDRAAALFARDRSLEARIGQALASWPQGTVAQLDRLASTHPRSAAVELNLGLALLWSSQPGGERAVRRAAALEPDSAYAVASGNVLYRSFAPNLPIFVPAEPSPAALAAKTAPQQLAILERQAASGAVPARLHYGVALQSLARPLSARRVFDQAARDAPTDVEAQVAAAVGHFDKVDPSEAFGRLGPLTRRFPHNATVRFHLGLLLLWMGSVAQGKKELQLATQVEPGSRLAREAQRYLDRLQKPAG